MSALSFQTTRAGGTIEREQQIAKRLQQARVNAGITQTAAAKAAGVHPNTWLRWERGQRAPKFWRAQSIAAALGIPLASLFSEGSSTCVGEVWVDASTLREIRSEGRGRALEVAERLARQLEPAVWQAATGRPARNADAPAYAKPRRSREQVLAGARAAEAATTAARLAYHAERLKEIQAAED